MHNCLLYYLYLFIYLTRRGINLTNNLFMNIFLLNAIIIYLQFRIERIYDKYKRLITRIFVQDDGTNDQLARIHSLTNTTAL